jgi:hypothetical protein
MSTDTERAAFEAWMTEDTTIPLDLDAHGAYADLTAEIMCHAWQARAAIAQQPAPCRTCKGDGIDGDPGDTPGTGYTWRCEDCNGTGRAAIAQPAEPTMEDAVAAVDGTLHGAIDHWQGRALKAEKALAAQADAQPVATYMGHRATPEGTREFWGIAPKTLTPGTPLFAAAPAARQPLTLEQLKALWVDVPDFTDPGRVFIAVARAIEKAHGITQEGE